MDPTIFNRASPATVSCRYRYGRFVRRLDAFTVWAQFTIQASSNQEENRFSWAGWSRQGHPRLEIPADSAGMGRNLSCAGQAWVIPVSCAFYICAFQWYVSQADISLLVWDPDTLTCTMGKKTSVLRAHCHTYVFYVIQVGDWTSEPTC